MPQDLLEQAFRSALLAAWPAWRPILWAFWPLLRSYAALHEAENWSLEQYGCLDGDD